MTPALRAPPPADADADADNVAASTPSWRQPKSRRLPARRRPRPSSVSGDDDTAAAVRDGGDGANAVGGGTEADDPPDEFGQGEAASDGAEEDGEEDGGKEEDDDDGKERQAEAGAVGGEEAAGAGDGGDSQPPEPAARASPAAPAAPRLAGGGGRPVEDGVPRAAARRGGTSQGGLNKAAADALKTVAESAYAGQSAEELFAKAKALNKEGKYKRACEYLEAAYALNPKIATALSAANLRLKIGEYAEAIEAYQGVLAIGVPVEEGGPSEREREMAGRKLAEAEGLVRESAINVAPLEARGEPRTPAWYASQLDELSEDLFSESATLYAEHGVALQDGLREVARHLRATRLLACGQVLRPVERLITRAVTAPRDAGEREWLTTVRTLLQELRAMTSEVSAALAEFDEQGRLGWKSAGEAMGFHTEWRHADETGDASLWFRMDGELTGAALPHAAAVAHEADLWPRWVPFCTAAETLQDLSPTERVVVRPIRLWRPRHHRPSPRRHAPLAPLRLAQRAAVSPPPRRLRRRGVADRQAALDVRVNVTLADFRASRCSSRPRHDTRRERAARRNVDLQAGSMPKALVSMVTKKIAGALLAAAGGTSRATSAARARPVRRLTRSSRCRSADVFDYFYLRDIARLIFHYRSVARSVLMLRDTRHKTQSSVTRLQTREVASRAMCTLRGDTATCDCSFAYFRCWPLPHDALRLRLRRVLRRDASPVTLSSAPPGARSRAGEQLCKLCSGIEPQELPLCE